MDTLIYLAKSTALLSLFFLTYEFLLKKETFFRQNRFFLLFGLTTAAFLPLLVFTKTVWVEPQAGTSHVLSNLSAMDFGRKQMAENPSFWDSLSIWDGLMAIYLLTG